MHTGRAVTGVSDFAQALHSPGFSASPLHVAPGGTGLMSGPAAGDTGDPIVRSYYVGIVYAYKGLWLSAESNEVTVTWSDNN